MIKKFFKFLYNYFITSTIEDFKYLKRLFTNNLKCEEKKKIKDLKTVYSDKNLFSEMLKRYWLFLFLIVLAWVVGFMIGALYGEYQANLQLNEILLELEYGGIYNNFQNLNFTYQ